MVPRGTLKTCMFWHTNLLDIFETPVTVTPPNKKNSKLQNSSKIPYKHLTFTFGERTFTLGERTFYFWGTNGVFGFFLEFPFFCCWGDFGTPWVGGPRRAGAPFPWEFHYRNPLNLIKSSIFTNTLPELGSYILRGVPKPWQCKTPDPRPTRGTDPP